MARRRVAVVTDSTALLAPESAAAHDLVVVPMPVVLAGETYEDGAPEVSSEAVAKALAAKTRISTSRPAPARMGEVYARLADQGYAEILSLHVSSQLSGTVESAQLAARTSPVPVVAVDSEALGPSLGYGAVAAALAADGGATAREAADAAMRRIQASRSYFYVDTLDYLRRGGRVGAAAALLGSALAVKPILALEHGVVSQFERVRTASRALVRLEDLAVEVATDGLAAQLCADGTPVDGWDVCVAHLASPERAAALAEHLAERLAEPLAGREVSITELGASLGAHSGPGTLAVVVSARV